MKTLVARVALLSACGLYLAGCAGSVELGPDAVKGKTVDATVEMRRCRRPTSAAAARVRASWSFVARNIRFRSAGSGSAVSASPQLTREGEVYNLRELSQFPGTYGQARYGFAIGSSSAGDLWMQNEAGVILRLKAKREGLILSLGGDAVVISMNP